MYGNKFLNDFIIHQQKLVQLEAGGSPTGEKDRKGRTKSKYGTKDGKKPCAGDLSAFEQLVQEKPGKKEVIDYFRSRIAELVAEDMK
jgi:hypothetical protein